MIITRVMIMIKVRTGIKTRIMKKIRTTTAHLIMKVRHCLGAIWKLIRQIPLRSLLQKELWLDQLAVNRTIALIVAPNKLPCVCGVKRANATRVTSHRRRDFGGNCLISVMITLIYAR